MEAQEAADGIFDGDFLQIRVDGGCRGGEMKGRRAGRQEVETSTKPKFKSFPHHELTFQLNEEGGEGPGYVLARSGLIPGGPFAISCMSKLLGVIDRRVCAVALRRGDLPVAVHRLRSPEVSGPG
ncbi:unnamed protein product [Pleuronectes platessa]|uniref:Uncharacterized protein n=1 Tax=Pleuronectes platessa TaxID=8262 RepID=A0A9N7VKH3_PLEPL|nr:unnamed protein product [Pleuronectes platessa]